VVVAGSVALLLVEVVVAPRLGKDRSLKALTMMYWLERI